MTTFSLLKALKRKRSENPFLKAFSSKPSFSLIGRKRASKCDKTSKHLWKNPQVGKENYALFSCIRASFFF